MARMSAPTTLALAPSATNTVVKPATNNSATVTVSRRTRGARLPGVKALKRAAGHIDRIPAAPAAARKD